VLQIEDLSTDTVRPVDASKPLKQTDQLVISCTLFVKDFLAPKDDSAHCYQIQLRSSERDNFFPDDMTPKKFLRDENVRAEVEGCLQVLQCQGVWIEAVIGKNKAGALQITNTQINDY
jgi:hypothetical protein